MLFREELVDFPGFSVSHVLAHVASAASLAQAVAFPGSSASYVLALVASPACPALAVVAFPGSSASLVLVASPASPVFVLVVFPGSSVSLVLALDSFLVLALALSLSDLVPVGAQSQHFLQRQACERHPNLLLLELLELLEPPPTFHFPVPSSYEILDPLEADHTRHKTSLHAS